MNYLTIILIFDCILFFIGFPKNNMTITALFIAFDICAAIICGITYYKVSGKKVVASIFGVLCLFLGVNIVITIIIIVKTHNFISKKKKRPHRSSVLLLLNKSLS